MIVWLLFACRPETSEPGEVSAIEIATGVGVRDLVAVPTGAEPHEIEFVWSEGSEITPYTTDRVPAHAVYPGQRWSVSARTASQSEPVTAEIVVPEPPGDNVLVVVLDDIGVDKLAMYGLNPLAPPTPTLDALARESVVFRRAYASPTCTPTRAEILTGRHGRRTGAGWLVNIAADAWELPEEAITLPEALLGTHGPSYSSAFLGKWHLAGRGGEGVLTHPNRQGFPSFAGTVGYLVNGSDGIEGYFSWRKNIDGAEGITSLYNTTDTADDTIARIESLPEPFFLVASFNASHVPLHIPPDELHTRPLGESPSDPELFAAMTEAMDKELGRVLDAMEGGLRDRTTIIVIGDNGTTDFVLDPGFDPTRTKHTLYEGGIRVPLLVSGPRVGEPGVSDALVHAVDVFTTVAEIAGVPLTEAAGQPSLDLGPDEPPRLLDGRSLLPMLADSAHQGLRERLFAQSFQPNGPPPWDVEEYALVDNDFKLIRRSGGEDELFAAPAPGGYDEGPNLLLSSPSAALLKEHEERAKALAALLERMPYEGL